MNPAPEGQLPARASATRGLITAATEANAVPTAETIAKASTPCTSSRRAPESDLLRPLPTEGPSVTWRQVRALEPRTAGGDGDSKVCPRSGPRSLPVEVTHGS